MKMRSVLSVNNLEWKPFQVEGSQGFEFKFGIIGKEYTDAYSVDLVRVAPGGFSPVHIDYDNHSFYFIEGEGVVTIIDKRWEVGPGSVVKIPFGVIHSIENVGDVDLLFITIYDPPRNR
ncbi:cupin domain-containing protein [Neobacillus pocheonensis]|uniref:cupin domain-containing protein n=1 Tax=Neobacillus pocheonensis TaxID=363869 RepID=UPI003D2B425A